MVFQIGRANAAVAAWRRCERVPFESSRIPPVAVLRPVMEYAAVPVMLASPTGHLWVANDGKPADPAQYYACLGIAHLADAMRTVEGAVTPTQLRSLLGQCVAGQTVVLCASRARDRMSDAAYAALRTWAALGAGIDAFGAVLYELGVVRRYAWAAEGCPIARRAHSALWGALQQDPLVVPQAAAESLSCPARRVDVEVITLRCAPFSPANRYFPLGVGAALRELQAVLRGVATRQPTVIFYENTAGLWKHPPVRAAVEAMLLACGAYSWESMYTSPHLHCGDAVRRPRVLYTGILKGALRAG